jgi:hypothetical protein
MILGAEPTDSLESSPRIPTGMISTAKEPSWISHEPPTDLFEPLDIEHTDPQHVKSPENQHHRRTEMHSMECQRII